MCILTSFLSRRGVKWVLKADDWLYSFTFVIVCNFVSFFLDFAADYDTLRALDSDNASSTRSMTEEEINGLPIHKYRVSVPPK